MLKIRILDWKLKHKVIFHIFVIGVMSGCLLLIIFLNSVRKVVETLNSRKMALVQTIIDDHIEHSLSLGTSPSMRPTLIEITGTGTVERARILDMEGKILHSSSREPAGTYIPDRERLLLKKIFEDSDQNNLEGVKMTSMAQSYLPVENKAECRSCHQGQGRFIGILDVKFEMSGETAVLHDTRRLAFGVAFLTLILMTFVTYRLYARIIDRPLLRLMKNMRRVEDGDLSPRLPVTKKDEFGVLSQSFNAMVGRLDEISQEIAVQHKLQMEKAGHLASLGELAAGLAHEIRNPISGIKGAAEVIAQQFPPEDPRKEIFEEIRNQADRIYDIVQNLLLFAKPRELTRRRENPNACVQAAVRMAEHQTEGKEILFRFLPLKEGGTAELDCDKLQEVVLNLLLNGIAAIDKKGEISTTMEERDGGLEIRIEDTGKGIPSEHLPLIFNPFFTTRKKGTGLGLSLCRQIVEAHGGTITAESEPGQGAVFIIRIPFQQGREESR